MALDLPIVKVVAVIQARMGSSRLKGKTLKPLGDRPVLGWLLDSAERAESISETVVATTTQSEDDEIERYCDQRGIATIRGSRDDVLSRFAQAAERFDAKYVVRLTADDPFKDPALIELITSTALQAPTVDFVSNVPSGGFPVGMGVEVMTSGALARLDSHETSAASREHVTTGLYQHPDEYQGLTLSLSRPITDVSFTLDTTEDFRWHERLLDALGSETWPWGWVKLVDVGRSLANSQTH